MDIEKTVMVHSATIVYGPENGLKLDILYIDLRILFLGVLHMIL